LPTAAAPLVPAIPPRPRTVGPQVVDVVPAVDVNPKIPLLVVVVAALLAVANQHQQLLLTTKTTITTTIPILIPKWGRADITAP